MKHVRHIDDSALTITRKKYGRGYRFYNEQNELIKSPTVLKRLKKLVIPPMWSDVMVCGFDDGHIQATGRDNKGRKQYIYHSVWERQRQEEKFNKLILFGEQLSDMRKTCYAHLSKKGWTKNKVLALLVLVLDECGIRIGNQQYVDKNNTYGLTTLRRRHMTVEDDALSFTFQGKSGKTREVHIEDDELIKLVKTSAELPGYEIFRYKHRSDGFTAIDSDEVNAYIAEHMSKEFSSKDFRTWVASRLAVEFYPFALEQKKSAPRKKFSNILMKQVADELGNTPTVCRNYYVHPIILDHIEQKTIPKANSFPAPKTDYELSQEEQIVLDLLTQ